MKFVFRLFVTFLVAILGVCIFSFLVLAAVNLFQMVPLCTGFIAVLTFTGGLLAVIAGICLILMFSMFLFALYSDWVDDAF